MKEKNTGAPRGFRMARVNNSNIYSSPSLTISAYNTTREKQMEHHQQIRLSNHEVGLLPRKEQAPNADSSKVAR